MSTSDITTANDSYSEYLQYSDRVNALSDDMTRYIALANDRVENSLFDNNSQVGKYVKSIEKAHYEQRQFINKMFALGVNAFCDIKKSVTSIDDTIKANNEENVMNHDYTQQQIRELEDKLDERDAKYERYFNLLRPPKITREHIDDAKYILENCKTSKGTSIKGATISAQNLQVILAYYDRLKELDQSDSDNEPEPIPEPKPTNNKSTTRSTRRGK